MDLKIGICIPSHGDWKMGFGYCLAQMCTHFTKADFEGEKEVEIFCTAGSILPEIRHKVLMDAIDWGATHILWLDTDMQFPKDTIHQLIGHNLPVVAANYSRRTFPIVPTAHNGKCVYTDDDSEGLEEVNHAGMGVMMTDARVYSCIDAPYFFFERDPSGRGVLGEDIYFCGKLREAGVKIFVDHDLSHHVGHIGGMTYWPEHAVKYREQHGDPECPSQPTAS